MLCINGFWFMSCWLASNTTNHSFRSLSRFRWPTTHTHTDRHRVPELALYANADIESAANENSELQ